MVTKVNWALAHCQDKDPDFFSEPALAPLAKEICSRCEIKDDCRTWAIETEQADCVWGGMEPDARLAISRPKSRVKCPGCKSSMVRGDVMTRKQLCTACGLTWRT